ncbi:MAG: hypothetical protein R2713_12495 [Ilumatobacteraceae bacterium]
MDGLIARAKGGMAFTLGGMGSATTNFYNPPTREAGYADAAQEVQWLVAGDKAAAVAAVPDELVLSAYLIGNEQMVRDRIRCPRLRRGREHVAPRAPTGARWPRQIEHLEMSIDPHRRGHLRQPSDGASRPSALARPHDVALIISPSGHHGTSCRCRHRSANVTACILGVPDIRASGARAAHSDVRHRLEVIAARKTVSSGRVWCPPGGIHGTCHAPHALLAGIGWLSHRPERVPRSRVRV